MKNPILFFVLLVYIVFTTHAARAAMQAHEFSLCNVTAVKIDLAVGYMDTGGRWLSEGWWILKPGECSHTFVSATPTLYYYAQSKTNLAKWIAENSSGMRWRGYTQFCAPNTAFHFDKIATCQNKIGFRKLKKRKVTDTRFAIKSEKNSHLKLVDAAMAHENLTALYNFETHLKTNFEKEAKFSLGVHYVGGTNLVSSTVMGMPGMEAGIEAGDRITKLFGYRVSTKAEIYWVLNQIKYDQAAPVEISIARNGHEMDGITNLAYFGFNDPQYKKSEAGVIGIASFVDSAMIGLGSEGLCAVGSLISQGLGYLDRGNFDSSAKVIDEIKNCANKLDRDLNHYTLMHKQAASYGDNASYFVGTGLIGKGAKALRANRVLSYAKRSNRTFKPTKVSRSF